MSVWRPCAERAHTERTDVAYDESTAGHIETTPVAMRRFLSTIWMMSSKKLTLFLWGLAFTLQHPDLYYPAGFPVTFFAGLNRFIRFDWR